jgi:hypothetical protein
LWQPCHDIGSAAVSTMIDRIAHPNMPARDVTCGAPQFPDHA